MHIQPQFTSRLRFADEAHAIVAGQFVPAELEIEYTGMASQRAMVLPLQRFVSPYIQRPSSFRTPHCPTLATLRHGCPESAFAASSENQPLTLDAVGSRYARLLHYCCMSAQRESGLPRLHAALSDCNKSSRNSVLKPADHIYHTEGALSAPLHIAAAAYTRIRAAAHRSPPQCRGYGVHRRYGVDSFM